MTTKAELEYLIRTQDSAITNLEAKVRQLNKELRATGGSTREASRGTRALDADVNKLTRGVLSGSGAFHSFGRSIAFASATFLGSAGITALVRQAISAASDLNEQTNKASVVFRGSQQEVLAWAKTTTTSFGISERAALDYASTFGNLLVPMGFVRKEAAAMSRELVQNAADLASFNNANPEQVLEDLRSGLAGQIEPLRKYGIFLNQGRIQEELLRAGIKGTWTELTNAQKAWGAYQIVLKDSKDAQGDFHRTSGDLANQQRTLRAAIEDTEAAIGKALLPEVKNITTSMTDWLSKTENQERVQRAVETAVHDTKAVLEDAGVVIEHINELTGGWKNTLEILIGLKVARTLGGWSSALAGLIGTGTAGKATGLLGADAAASSLVGRLRKLAGFAGLVVTVTIIEQLIRASGSATSEGTKLFGGYLTNSGNPMNHDGVIVAGGNIGDTGYVRREKGVWVPYVPKPGDRIFDGRGFTTFTDATRTAVKPTPATTGGGVQIPTVFTPTHDTTGLAGFPAVDIMAKPGTPIKAPEDGVITRVGGHEPSEAPPLGQGGPWGLSLYFIGSKTGNTYFMTHLVKVGKPGRYRKGDVIGVIGDYPGSDADHVHVGVHRGDAAEAHIASSLLNPADFDITGSGGGTSSSKPPPGGGGGGSSELLPVSIRQRLADAKLTLGSTADDAAATRAAIAFVRTQLRKHLGPEKRLDYTNELAGLLADLKGFTTAKTGGASAAGLVSVREQVNALLRGLPKELDDVESEAVKHLKRLRAHLKVGMDAKDLAETRAQIRKWGKTLKDEISSQSKLAAAAAAEAAKLTARTWSNDANRLLRNFDEQIVTPQLDAFEKETRRRLAELAAPGQTAEEKALADFVAGRARGRHDQELQRMQDAVAAARAAAAKLGVPISPDGLVVDVSAGTSSVFAMTQAQLDAIESVRAAQLELDTWLAEDAKDTTQAQLEQAAQASRTQADAKAQADQDAYQEDRTRQRRALEDKLADQRTFFEQDLDDWNGWIGEKSKSWAGFLRWLAENGVDSAGIVNPYDPTRPSSGTPGDGYLHAGRMIGMAGGGEVPGIWVGRDNVPVLATPGENMLDRSTNQMLRAFLERGGSGLTIVVKDNTLLGDDFEIARKLADIVAPELDRRITL